MAATTAHRSTSHRGFVAHDALSRHHVVLPRPERDDRRLHGVDKTPTSVWVQRPTHPGVVGPGVVGSETEDRCDREEFVGVGDRVEVANQAALDLDRDEGDRTSVADRHELTSASTGHREEHCP